MFPLRLVHCELGGFGVLPPSLSFNPGFNLIVGDAQSGKTSLVRALVAAFRGLPPPEGRGTGPRQLGLQLQAPEDVLELRVDWSAPSVELSALPDRRLFRNDSSVGLLEILEGHTGLSGLAYTCFLSAETFGAGLFPPAVHLLQPQPPGVEGPEVEVERRRLAARREELTGQREQILAQHKQVEGLKERLEPLMVRFKSVPDGFLQLLSDLLRTRQEVPRLKAAEAAHQEAIRTCKAEFQSARAGLRTRFGGLVDVDSDYPIFIKRYKKIEQEFIARQGAQEGVLLKLRTVTARIMAHQMPLDPLPEDFEAQIMALMEATTDEDVQPVETGLEEKLQEVMDALTHHDFDSRPSDFPARLAELAAARSELETLLDENQSVEVRLYEVGLQGVLHQEAARWPEDFDARLAAVRQDQQARQAQVAALTEEAAAASPLLEERAALVQRIEDFKGLPHESANFPDKIAAMGRDRQVLAADLASLEERRSRLATIEQALATEYAWLNDFGEDYPAQLDGLAGEFSRAAAERQAVEETRASIARLKAERDTLVRRLEEDMADIHALAPDVPERIAEYARLVRLQQAVEARREALRAQHAELLKQRDRDFGEFKDLPASTVDRLAEVRARDVLLHRLLVQLDDDIAERHRIELGLTEVDARLGWLPALPEGVTALHAFGTEHERWQSDLDRLILAVAEGRPSGDLQVQLDKFYEAWCEEQSRAVTSRELAAARAHLEALQQDLEKEALPLDETEVQTWMAGQEEWQALLASMNVNVAPEEGAPRVRKVRKMTWLGGSGSPMAGAGDARQKMGELERERIRQAAAWKLSSPEEVPALLERDRVARERLAAAQARVALYLPAPSTAAPAEQEGEAGPAPSPDEPPATPSTEADALLRLQAMLESGESRQRLLELAADRHKVASLVETERGSGADFQFPTSDEAQERFDRLQAERAALESRLDGLRPLPTLEAERRDILDWVAKGLADLAGASEDKVRQLLAYQHTTQALAELQAAVETARPESTLGQLMERVAQQRQALQQALGPLLAGDVGATTLGRYEEFNRLQQEVRDHDARLADMPGIAALNEKLESIGRDLQRALQRLHVQSEEAVGEARSRYQTWRSLLAERTDLTAAVAAEAARLQTRVAAWEQAGSPWGLTFEGHDRDARALLDRWQAARDAVDALAALDIRIAELRPLETVEAATRDILQAAEEACRLLGVPWATDEDADLLQRWSDYAAWREKMAVLTAERDRALVSDTPTANRLDDLKKQIKMLQTTLALDENTHLDDAREDFLAAQMLRTEAESLSARLVRSRELEAGTWEHLSNAGLPVIDDDPRLSLEKYRAYGSLLLELRSTEQEVEEAQKDKPGTIPVADLQLEMSELRPHLGGREKVVEDVAAEVALFAEYQAAVSQSDDLEMGCAALEADSQPTYARQQAEEALNRAQSRLGEWIKTGDPEALLTDYQRYVALRNDMVRLRESLGKLPALENLTAALQTTERAIAAIRPAPVVVQTVQETPEEAFHHLVERSQARASEILSRVSGSRYSLRFKFDEARVVSEGDEEGQPATGDLARQIDLWWRLAVCLELRGSHPWPILLDDPFVGLDTLDQMNLSDLLLEVAAERQVIVLTRNRGLALDVNIDLNQTAAPAR